MVNMQETFAGIRVVKSHAREEYERERFNKASTRMLEFIMRWRKAMEIVGPLVETVASIGIAAGLVYAKVANINFEDFLLMNMALMSMYPPAKALGRVQVQLQKCVIATSKVFGIIDMVPDVEDYERAHSIDPGQARGAIKFEGVTFSYTPGIPRRRRRQPGIRTRQKLCAGRQERLGQINHAVADHALLRSRCRPDPL